MKPVCAKGLLTAATKSDNRNNESKLTDEYLVECFINGDKAAYSTLVARYKKRVYEFIYFQLKQDQYEAEDLTQNVFVELYNKAQNFRSESKFSSYIFAVAKNQVLNHYRSFSRRFSLLDKFKLLTNSETETLEAQQQINSEHNQLIKHINGLSVEERQLILLANKENFSYQQISEILELNVGTVRSRLHSARQKLIERLGSNAHG